ncbi:hypothetical protein [Nonomuraea fuscirosea]
MIGALVTPRLARPGWQVSLLVVATAAGELGPSPIRPALRGIRETEDLH